VSRWTVMQPSAGWYDRGGWHPVTFIRCNACCTIIAEDGFLLTYDTPAPTPKSARAQHEAVCFGEANP